MNWHWYGIVVEQLVKVAQLLPNHELALVQRTAAPTQPANN
jgi:hypothetical protein